MKKALESAVFGADSGAFCANPCLIRKIPLCVEKTK